MNACTSAIFSLSIILLLKGLAAMPKETDNGR
jgi:hypothetical protein